MTDVVLTDTGAEALSASGALVTATTGRRHDEMWIEVDEPAAATRDAIGPLLRAITEDAVAAGARAVHWATEHPDRLLIDAIAAEAGLAEHRDLLQLRRSLPVEDELRTGVPVVTTRAFRPGSADEEAWVRTNNRAFADHPDQGRESLASFRATMASPWFAADDLRLLDEVAADPAAGMAAFCWTKRHPATSSEPARGEIFVIGVDPDHQAGGLGAAVVLAGLDHLASLGLATAMLYVEADNSPALRLYDRLGFTEHLVRRVRSRSA